MQMEEAPHDEAPQHKDTDMGFNENGTGASPAGPLAALFNREVRTNHITPKPSRTLGRPVIAAQSRVSSHASRTPAACCFSTL